MRVIIITGNYYPNPSQNGEIANNIAEAFQQKNHDVEIICFDKGDIINPSFETHQLRTHHRFLMNYFNRKNSKTGKNLISGYRSLFKTFLNKSPDSWYSKNVFKTLEMIESKREIDIIVSLSSPIEAHIAAINFGEKFKKKVVLYWLDQYSDVKSFYNYMLFKNMAYKKNVQIEKELTRKATLNLIPYTREAWVRNTLNLTNYRVIDFPLTKKKRKDLSIDQKKIIYTGAFYKHNRNPEKLLEVFTKNFKDLNLHLFWFGDCSEVIKKYEDFPNIVNHNRVGKEELVQHLENTNFLLNIGNQNEKQLPSKIYEYMNYEKPIINIFYTDDYYPVLKDYPHYLSIKYDSLDSENSIKKMRRFIDNYIRNDVAVYDVDSFKLNYKSTPEYFYKVILKELSYE